MSSAQRAHRLLEQAYRNTTYRVRAPGDGIDIRVDQRHPNLDELLERSGVATWAIVTAFNPHSVRLPEAENLSRHEALVGRVRSEGWTALEADGLPPDGTWLAERGLLIYGIGEADAISLAASFQQNAIIIGERHRPARLIWIDEQRRR